MDRSYKELTETEQEKFAETFYGEWEYEEDDTDTPMPWGCPWLDFNVSNQSLMGSTVEESAVLYYKIVRHSIASLIAEE